MVTSPRPLVGNVTMLRTNTVYEDITTFLKRKNIGKGDKLQGTAAEYERDINRFFQIMLNKTINELTIKDLDVIKRSDVERYQTFLVEQGYKSATVNRNIDTMKGLYRYFQENNYRYKDGEEWIYIRNHAFYVDDVVLNDAKTYGMFSHDEVMEMIKRAKSLPDGESKSLAIEFASKTAFRIEAICNLTLDDFRKEGTVWVAKTIDKNKIHEKSIKEEFYNRLVANAKDKKIFSFSTKTLERAINQLVDEMNLDPDRNLTFHSIKKYSMGEVYRITKGDPLAVAKHGNHASFETSMKYYLLFGSQYETMPSLLVGEELDLSPIENMSKEELVQLIGKASRALQYELLHLINEKQ